MLVTRSMSSLIFLSTPSARRATPAAITLAQFIIISIHALREEGDSPPLPDRSCRRISIHALREEGDDSSSAATAPNCYFYPRPPRGGRLQLGCISQSLAVISIHALREEGDR